MSFSVAKRGGRKRLARKARAEQNDSPTPTVEISTDIYIVPYTERSFVVMGDTLNHSNALVTLGGKYNTNLRIGQGWIFAKVREQSVRNYIETKEIIPHVYSQEDINRFEKRNAEKKASTNNDQQIRRMFQDFRDAFDPDLEYEGSSIIEVIDQLQDRYLSKKSDDKDEKEKSPPAEQSDDDSDNEVDYAEDVAYDYD